MRRILHSFPTRRSSDLKLFQVFKEAHYNTNQILAGLDVEIDYYKQQVIEDKKYYETTYEKHHKKQTQYRSEEHTSELQSRGHLVCRLLLAKKNTILTSQ